jgi:GT2 family glycosyltransferase
MRVLVSILNYRQPEESLDAARSFRAQNHPDTVVQILDNGSGDGSVERFRAQASSLGVRVAETGENLGYTGGNNRALEQGLREGFDLVVVANSDVLVEPDAITSLVETSRVSPRVGVVGGVEVDHASGRVRTTGGTRFPDWRFRFRWPVEDLSAVREPRRRVAFVHGALVGFTRAALESGVRFDERLFMFYDEVELGWALADARLEAWVDLRVPYRHRNRPDSFRELTGYFMQRNRVYLARKRFPLWKRALFLAWVALAELPAKLVVRSAQGHRAFARACRMGFADGLAGRMGRGRLEEVL